MNILLAVMMQSPYSRSIWTGLARGFVEHGCRIEIVAGERIPPLPALGTRPDLLLAVHGLNFAIEAVRQYRDAGIPTGVYLLDEPYEVDLTSTWSRDYDWAFSVDRATVPVHAAHAQAHHLPLGFDASVFGVSGPAVKSEILVLGSPFAARNEFLAPLVRDFGSRITWVGPGWRQLTPLGHHHATFVTPEGCAAFYRGADMVINIHRDSLWSHHGDRNARRIEATHLNPRFWEAGACGAFQIVSYRADLDTVAPEVPSFRTPLELLSLVDHYLSDMPARNQIAQAVRERLAEHSYRSRAGDVLRVMQLGDSAGIR